MKKRAVTIITDVVTENKNIEPQGASMIEFIRDTTCDDTITIMGAIKLNDYKTEHAFIYPTEVEIKNQIPVRFADTGTVKLLVVVKSIFSNE